MITLWLLLACGRKAPPPTQLDWGDAPPTGSAMRSDVIGPTAFEGAGLCLDLPTGWSGTSGPPPHLLEIHDAQQLVTLRLQVWPWGTRLPQDRPGFELIFSDAGGYRILHRFGLADTYTLGSADGLLVQGWTVPYEGRVVVTEFAATFGHHTLGLEAVERLLAGLKPCGDAGRPAPGGR